MGGAFYSVLFCISLIVSPILGVEHELVISYANGETISHYSDEPELTSSGPVNETCHTGVWLIYEGANYTDLEWVQLLYEVEGNCVDPSMPEIKSIRRVGVVEDGSLPSVTFYSGGGGYASGDAHLVTDGVPTIDFSIHSLITINSNVEFFRSESYGGDSFCLELGSCFGSGVCVGWSLDFLGELPWEISLARSAKIGCNHGNGTHNQPINPIHHNMFA